jgi:hypothetical protein
MDEDDVVLGPGERWADQKVLGSGHHADVQLQLALQLAFLQIQSLFVSGELVYRPADRKKAPAGTVAKTAAVFGVGEKTVQATVTDATVWLAARDSTVKGPGDRCCSPGK